MSQQPKELTPDRSARDLFGAKMRACRERAGMSLEGLAHVVNVSRSHLARIETAEALAPPSLPPMLDATFETDGIFQELYRIACKEIHPAQYRRSMELEARARLIEVSSGEIIPGLIQTAPYARALIRATNPDASDERVEELVAARMDRQERLRTANPPRLCVVLSEAAVRRAVGGPAAMREQLATILELMDSTSTVVQLLPFEQGEHGLLGGTLKLMTYGKNTVVAWEESIATGTLNEDVERVTTRRYTYDLLRSHALPPSQTAAFIRSVMEALPS